MRACGSPHDAQGGLARPSRRPGSRRVPPGRGVSAAIGPPPRGGATRGAGLWCSQVTSGGRERRRLVAILRGGPLRAGECQGRAREGAAGGGAGPPPPTHTRRPRVWRPRPLFLEGGFRTQWRSTGAPCGRSELQWPAMGATRAGAALAGSWGPARQPRVFPRQPRREREPRRPALQWVGKMRGCPALIECWRRAVPGSGLVLSRVEGGVETG